MVEVPYYVEVDYYDPSHRYYRGNITYTSATQVLEEFKEHFNAEEMSVYMADRYGNDPQYWKEQWKQTNGISLVRGNEIHNAREGYLYGRGVDTVDGVHLPVQNRALLKQNIPYIELPDGVYPELKLWHHGYRIAGRSDKIILRTDDETQRWMSYAEYNYPYMAKKLKERFPGKPLRMMDVEDYKTNKAIRTESFYTRDRSTGKKIYRMMLGPLSHLMDCEMVHYTLQLSIYQFMGEYMGFLPGKRRIIHYQHEIEGLGTPEPKIYELPYLRDEVIAMLESRMAS